MAGDGPKPQRRRAVDTDPKNKSPDPNVHTQTYLGQMAVGIKADMTAKAKRKRKQPYKRNEKIEQALWTGVANGASLKDLCKDEKMPSLSTVHNWMSADPEFEAYIDRAHLYQARYRHDEIKDIVDGVNQGDLSIEERKLKFKGYVWLAEKNNAARYGNQVNVHVQSEGPAIILPAGFGGGVLSGTVVEGELLPAPKSPDENRDET